jgi:hypothetical protein
LACLDRVDGNGCVPNHGIIVVFQIRRCVADEPVCGCFKKVGDIRESRATPERGTQRFVEYWDLRDCQRALLATNGKRVLGSNVRVEYSTPGGIRKNQTYSRKADSRQSAAMSKRSPSRSGWPPRAPNTPRNG